MELAYPILLFVHVLLFVFWIGTDVGVFVLGKVAQSPRYSPQRRAESFETALILDRLPRVCFALMLPVGATLATMIGAFSLSPNWLVAIWIGGLVWLACVFVGFLHVGGALWKAMRSLDRLIQAIVCITLLSLGLPSILGQGAIEAPWLAWKLAAFGALAGAALTLDFLSSPVPALFAQLATNGSSPVLETRIDRSMNRIYVFVAAIYVAALVAAFCGITKLPG